MSAGFELEFVIRGMSFDVEFDDEWFTEDEQKEILDFVDQMSKEIAIDRSYVECKENKHKSTFMLKTGWEALRDLMADTKYGKYLHPLTQLTLIDAFCTMGRCYMVQALELVTDKLEHMALGVNESSDFTVVVCKDVANEWKTFPGDWQDWEFDDEGLPIFKKSEE